MQACCLQQHAATTVHKVATKSFLLPDLPISQCLPYSLKDQQLLNGNVPQPLDWLRAWRACKATASFEGAVSFYQTDDFARGCRRRTSSRSLRCMIIVMHWAVRKLRKERLMAATSISVSVDDRKDHRLVRYRCSFLPQGTGPRAQEIDSNNGHAVQDPNNDREQEPASFNSIEDWCRAPPVVQEGLLGVYRLGGDVAENTLESHDQDKSDSMASSIHTVLEQGCRDPDGCLDNEALDAIRKRIHHFASDQGPSVMKCSKIIASDPRLPNIVWASYDPAHQVRNAFKDPLSAEPEFNQQWERLFGHSKSLVPLIQNSEVWKARLIAAQRAVCEQHGSQGGIDKIMRNLSIAKHRFDSAGTPMFKYCCAIRAIALVCGMQAADEAFACFGLCLVVFFDGLNVLIIAFSSQIVAGLGAKFTEFAEEG